MAINHVFSNGIADGTNTQIVRPSDWNSVHNLYSTIVGNTAGQSTVSGTNIVLAAGNNVTLSANGSTISIVGAAGGATTGLVPYTGASESVDLNSNWLTNQQGIAFSTGAIPRTVSEGVMAYDYANRCISIDYMNGARLQVGQEHYVLVYNNSGTAISDGQAVYQNGSARIEYVSGSFVDVPTILEAQANSKSTSDVIGVTTTDIADQAFGYVTQLGKVNDLDTSAWNAGDQLYLSASSPGVLTSTAPTAPDSAVLVARVLRSHATAGNILIKIARFANLSDLLDTDISTPAADEYLRYVGGKWINQAAPPTGIQALAGSNGSYSASTFSFGNLNGASFYTSNSSMVVSYTVPSVAGLLSNIKVSAGTSSTNLSALTFSDANGISFGLNGSVVTASVAAGGAPGSISAGTTNVALGEAVFSNSNGITFGLNGSTVTASHNGLTTAALSNHSHGNPTLALTNLSGTTASASNGLTLSLSAAAPSQDGVNIVQMGTTGTTGTTYSASTGTVFLNGSNNVTVSQNASNQIVISGPTLTQYLTTAALSNHSHGNPTLNLTNISGTTASDSAGLTLSLSAAAPGGGVTLSGYNPYGLAVQSLGQQVGQASLIFAPVDAPAFQFDRILMPINNTNNTNSSGSHTLSFWFGIYSRNDSTLSLIQSTSTSLALTHSGTAGSYSLYSGMRNVTIPFTTTLPANNYWIAVASRTTSAGANGSYSQLLVSQAGNNYFGVFGQSANNTNQLQLGRGFYTVTTSGIPGSVAFSQIQGTTNQGLKPPIVYFQSGTA